MRLAIGRHTDGFDPHESRALGGCDEHDGIRSCHTRLDVHTGGRANRDDRAGLRRLRQDGADLHAMLANAAPITTDLMWAAFTSRDARAERLSRGASLAGRDGGDLGSSLVAGGDRVGHAIDADRR